MPETAHFILVDFQNVTKVDLDRLEVSNVVLLLFLGGNQKKLSATLEKQVINHPAEVRLIKVGHSAPNALDKRLVEYLGGLCSRHPGARFHILSKDKDYDLVVACLVSTGLKVARYDAFEDLPIITPKKSGASRAPFASVQPVTDTDLVVAPPKPTTSKPDAAAQKRDKLIKHLRSSHPPTREALHNTIKHHYQSSLPKGGMKGVIADLMANGVLTFAANDKITYFNQ